MASNSHSARYFGDYSIIDCERERQRQLELEYEDFMEEHGGEDPYYYKEPYASWLRG